MKFALRPFVCIGLAALALTGCTRKLREHRLLKVANEDYQAGRYDRAEREYRQCLLWQHLDPLPMDRVALIYFYEGRVGVASQWLMQAHKEDPGDLQVLQCLADAEFAIQQTKAVKTYLAELLAKAGPTEDDLSLLAALARTPADAAQARAQIEALRSKHPDCAAFHIGLGILALPDAKAAGREFAAAAALNPNSPGAHGGLAGVAVLEHDDARAIAEYQKAADHSPLRSIWRIKQMDTEVHANHFETARAQAKALTTAAPDDVTAWIERCKLDAASGDYDDAATDATQVLERDPKNFDGMLQKGAVALARGDFPAAIADFQDAALTYRKVPLIEYQLGVAYQRNHQAILARQHWVQALGLDSNYYPPALTLAESEIDDQSPAEAVNVLTTLIKSHPRINQAYLILGRAQLLLKNSSGALETFRRMQSLFPEDPEGFYREGLVRLQLMQPTEAHLCFEHALALRPTFAPAAEMLVNDDLQQHDAAAAKRRVDAYRKEFPQSPGPWLLEAQIYISLKDSAKAREDLHKAIDLQPKDPNGYRILADLDGGEHRFADAEKDIQGLIERAPSPGAYLELGDILVTEKKYEEARQAYTHVLTYDPKSIVTLDKLAGLSLDQFKEPAQAQSYARQAYDADPTSAEANLTLGWVLVMRGDLRAGQPLLEESARRMSGNFEAQYHLGLAYYYMGDKDAAAAKLKLAASLAPKNAVLANSVKVHLAVIQYNAATGTEKDAAFLADHIKNDPKDGLATADLAALEARFGRAEAAAAHYEKAATLLPGDAGLRMALADLYSGPLHSPAKANENAKLAHELAPDDPNIALALGRLSARSGDYAWSLDLLQQASRHLPNDNVLALDLAVAYYRVGDLARASDALPDSNAVLPPDSRDRDSRFRAMLAASRDPVAAGAAAAQAGQILAADPHFLPARMVSAMAVENRGDLSGAADRYSTILDQDKLFLPAAKRLALADYKLGRYDQVVNTVQANPVLTGTAADSNLLYCYGLSLFHLKQADPSRTQLKRALLAGLTPAQEADVRKALKELK
jgi:tetratricopeptide (TPR) repeat protein